MWGRMNPPQSPEPAAGGPPGPDAPPDLSPEQIAGTTTPRTIGPAPSPRILPVPGRGLPPTSVSMPGWWTPQIAQIARETEAAFPGLIRRLNQRGELKEYLLAKARTLARQSPPEP